MKHNTYPVSSSPDRCSYTFESISSEKIVIKKVEFVSIADGLYNLAFGDLNSTGALDDMVTTNNNDMKKVLATVIQIVRIFLELHPDAAIYFEGSTSSRTRLYQIILAQELLDWSDKFVIYGAENGRLLPFEVNRNFDSFVVKIKKIMRSERKRELTLADIKVDPSIKSSKNDPFVVRKVEEAKRALAKLDLTVLNLPPKS
ncbi:DUF6934 family protein [Dyadobacter crusticola]|uniref:DUF6934 family protein n=1 Tax=Dyadobacter crusticola TaxID=292407 RepID=UPI0012F8E5A6|nr:hypothetical protein [Dyadobacter crusticola]